ncbi:hypothetical protein HK104_009173 [Borealophlyctis nickersoniae]|nr:hypothetical protein HK104_009173 [Borealophlyctis nickersoniae]
MSENDENIETQSEPQAEPPVPQKKKRVVSEQAKQQMMANLAKAREVRAKNLKSVTKYPKEKRQRAQEMNEKIIEEKAEELARQKAQDLIEKEKQEKELEEYHQWKQQQTKEESGSAKVSKTKPKATKTTKEKATTKATTKGKGKQNTARGAKTKSAKVADNDSFFD